MVLMVSMVVIVPLVMMVPMLEKDLRYNYEKTFSGDPCELHGMKVKKVGICTSSWLEHVTCIM